MSLDAADPSDISEIDRMGTYGDVLSLSLDGDALYAGTSEKVYRIAAADPADFYQLGKYYYFGERVVSVKGSGAYAYAATDAGFYVIDFSDAANPYIATDFGEGVMACGGVDVADDVVYLAARDVRALPAARARAPHGRRDAVRHRGRALRSRTGTARRPSCSRPARTSPTPPVRLRWPTRSAVRCCWSIRTGSRSRFSTRSSASARRTS